MDFTEARSELKRLLKRTRPEHVGRLVHWLTSSDFVDSLLSDNPSVILNEISADLRSALPPEAMFPEEELAHRKIQERARRTVHVDAFLFDENLLDSMCEEGKFSRSYCRQCGSTQTENLDLLSHSFSAPELRFLFCSVLPDLCGRTVVDVGSRLGAVLYAGHLFSSAHRLIGIELNPDFVKLQQQILHKYKMADRAQVIHSDLLHQGALLATADVLVLNNVFEFFLEPEQQRSCWRFLQQSFRRPGCLLVTVPSLKESFSKLQETLPSDWLEELPVNYDLYWTSDSAHSEAFREIHLYRVM